MITSQQILEELAVCKRESGVPFVYSDNPRSMQEIFRDLKNQIRSPQFKEDPTLRFSYDEKADDLCIWSAWEVNHHNFWDIVSPSGHRDFSTFAYRGAIDLHKKEWYGSTRGVPPEKRPKEIPPRLAQLFRDYTFRGSWG